MKKLMLTLVALFSAVQMSACGNILSRQEVVGRARVLSGDIAAAAAASEERLQRAQQLVVRVDAPWLSGRTQPLSREASLPAVFTRSSAFVRPPASGEFTIPQVGELISRVLGIRVRVRPDVFLPASMLIPGGGSSMPGDNDQGPAAVAPPPMAAPPMMIPPDAMNVAPQQGMGGYDATIDFDFTGSLTEYLGRLSSRTGINWEWNDKDQELVLFRLVRKTFLFDTSPTSVTLSSTVSKGASVAGGVSGGSGSGASPTTGSTSSDSTTTLSLSASAWESVLSTLNRMRTQAGAVEANPATRSITLIDTRDVIADADRYLAQQNEILSRQVLINVRLVNVATQRTDATDININAMLQRFNAEGQANWRFAAAGVGAQTAASAENLTYTVLSPTASASGSQAILNILREIGDVVDEYSQEVLIRNNHTTPLSDYSSYAYLAQTTPATSTASGSTTGAVPGLTPGTATSGTTMLLTPSILSGDKLSLLLSLDRSNAPTFETVSTGSGATLQQIQLPRQTGLKFDTEVGLSNGATLVLASMVKDSASARVRNGALSFSHANEGERQLQVLFITPRIVGDH